MQQYSEAEPINLTKGGVSREELFIKHHRLHIAWQCAMTSVYFGNNANPFL